jgi:hypothetical protein
MVFKNAKIVDKKSNLCDIYYGDNIEWGNKQGYTLLDVEQSEIDNQWYLAKYCPHKEKSVLFQEAVSAKLEENNKKADEKRYNQTFTLTIQKKECLFDTSAKTNSDIQTATLYILAGNETYDGWISNNGIVLNLTKDNVVAIASKIRELVNVYPTWKKYYDKINSCTTIEEVNAIEIEY